MGKRTKNQQKNRNNKKSKPHNKKKEEEDDDMLEDAPQDNLNEEERQTADFYLQDGENLDFGDDDDEEGSALDFGPEDYIESEGEEEDEDKEPKGLTITKEDLNKSIKSANSGNLMGINRLIILFAKITNPNQNIDSLDPKNVLNKVKYINQIIKFCIKDLPNIINLKAFTNNTFNIQSKPIIKRFITSYSKFLKHSEPNFITFAFKHIMNIVDLICLFKNHVEVFLKIACKIWTSQKGNETSNKAYSLIVSILEKKPENFENILKLAYVNYLNVAKAMNWNTFERIYNLQMDIVSLLSIDLDMAYKTIFAFIRKLAIQLRLTINDKKNATIKNIYNWQFVNALKLWNQVIIAYHKEKNNEINLLTYPLIQTIIGVIRLNLVDIFYPLRLHLVKELILISKNTGIFIPTAMYLIEILQSNHFSKFYRSKESQEEINLDTPITLKLRKEHFQNYSIILNIFDEVLDLLKASFAVNINNYSFPEILASSMHALKKIAKETSDKNIREKLKSFVELVKNECSVISEIRINNQYTVLNYNQEEYEEKVNKNEKLTLLDEFERLRKKNDIYLEGRLSQINNKFIEI